MKYVNARWASALACATAMFVAACGGGDQSQGRGDEAAKPVPQSEETLAQAPKRAQIERAGCSVVAYKPFPAQLPARIGSIVVYRASSGKQGGVLYFQRSGKADDLVFWHWYFDDAAPDSAQAVEINEDGLWDVRIFMKGGDTVDYVQEEDFTFSGKPRYDLVATNGKSSNASDVWMCFDGDTTSAWVGDVSRDAYIDLPTPLGADAGVLTLRADPDKAPRKVEIEVDGKKVKDVELAETSREQRIQLEAVGVDSRDVRLVFKSGHAGNAVGVTEIGLK